MVRCLGACFGILLLASGTHAALASQISFPLPAVGVGTPFTVSAGGISARFRSDGDPYGFHVEPSTFPAIAGPVLVDSGISPDASLAMDITFSETVDSVSFGFALDTVVPSALAVLAVDHSSVSGGELADGQVPASGGVAEGEVAYSGTPFDELLLDDPTDPAFAIGEVTVSPIPEPPGWATFGLGLLAVLGGRRVVREIPAALTARDAPAQT